MAKDKKIIKIVDILSPHREEPREEPVEFEEPVLEEELEFEIEPEPKKIVEEEQMFPEGLFHPKKTPKRKKKIFVIAGITCIVLIVLAIYFSSSRAEVVIKPKTETMQFNTNLNLDKNIAFIDLESSKIPAQFFQVEKEDQKEFPATREEEVREKARGTVTVYNQYSSAPQTLVKGTRFVSEKEKLFRMVETVIIPGAKIEEGQIIPSSIDVKVEAAEPGKDYNIGPSTFTIPGFKGTAKYTGFYGKSTQSMSGGAIGKVKVVNAEDIQAAKEILAVELKKKAREELEKGIPSDISALKDAIVEEIVDFSSSVEANQPAEKFTIKVKVAVKTLGFSIKDAVSLINSNFRDKISDDKSLIPDTMEIDYSVIDINLEKGTAKLSCEVKEELAWKVDTENIRKEIIGKSENEVRQYLSSRAEIESAKVIFWPLWVKKMPSKENKIKVSVD